MKATIVCLVLAIGLATAVTLRGQPLTDNKEMIKPEYTHFPDASTGAAATTGCEPEQETECEKEVPKFKPTMVQRGHFSGEKEEKVESHKPTMVATGAIAEQRRAEMAAEKARVDAILEARQQKEEQVREREEQGACELMGATLKLAKAMYSLEHNTDGSSKPHVTKLIDSVCPTIKSKFPNATKDIECGKISKQVSGYYDHKYKGKVPQTKEEVCGGKKPVVKNFAMAQALHSVNNLWDITFCSDTEEPLTMCEAAADADADAEAESTGTSEE